MSEAVKMWALKRSDGEILQHTASPLKTIAWSRVAAARSEEDFKWKVGNLEEAGWTCVPVEVRELLHPVTEKE